MSTPACRRHDISDRVWALLEPHLLGQKGQWGRVARDNRLFINAVFWILRTGAPWRDLPSEYGDWKNTHRRFCRWRDKELLSNLVYEVRQRSCLTCPLPALRPGISRCLPPTSAAQIP